MIVKPTNKKGMISKKDSVKMENTMNRSSTVRVVLIIHLGGRDAPVFCRTIQQRSFQVIQSNQRKRASAGIPPLTRAQR